MPKLTKEIAQGTGFQFSTGNGELNASQTRVFKVLLNTPGELFDIQATCGVFIGHAHPYNPLLYCTAYDAKFDGDSRMVVIVTFTYEAHASSQGDDPNKNPPNVRPANWSVATSLAEMPAYEWRQIGGQDNGWKATTNPTGDLYEGITRLEPMVTITIDQFEPQDPTRHCLYAGCVNSSAFTIGTLQCQERSVMFRGVSSRPHVESWGQQGTYRGWLATYEFMYRKNYVARLDVDIGWDRAEPQVGYNIINKEEALGGGANERGALALAHSGGKIRNWPDDPDLAKGTKDQKVRAMLLVGEHDIDGVGQRPVGLPIPLNDDGTPRSHTAEPPVKIYRYQVYKDINFGMFNLRLT